MEIYKSNNIHVHVKVFSAKQNNIKIENHKIKKLP